MDNWLGILVVMVAFAYLVETLGETLFETLAHLLTAVWPALEGVLFPAQPGHVRRGVVQALTLLAGMAGAWWYQFDLVSLLMQSLQIPAAPSAFGIVITGLAIGKGSNYLHETIKRYFRLQPEDLPY